MKFKYIVDDEITLLFPTFDLASSVFQVIDDDRGNLVEWMSWTKGTKEVEDVENFIIFSLTEYAKGNALTCFIEYKGSIAGCIGFNTIDRSLKKAELGYWLSTKYQGNGVINRSAKYLVDYAFDNLGVEKVEIHVATGNRPSQKVCERLGSTLEGTIKNSITLYGEILDLNIYGIYK